MVKSGINVVTWSSQINRFLNVIILEILFHDF
jgi:hypothetical protein